MWRNKKGFTPLAAISGLLLFFLLLLIGWQFNKINNDHQIKNNAAYLSKLAQTTLTLYQAQAKVLGIKPDNQDLSKTCYQTEQDDFNNGQLHCGIRVNKKFQVQPDNAYIDNLLDKLVTVIKNEGFVIIDNIKANPNGAVIGAGIYNGTGPPCTLHVDYSPTTTYPDAKTSMGYELDCSSGALSVPAGFTYVPLR